MEYTFYRETLTNYVGSTKLGMKERKRLHKNDFYNENRDGFNKPMFKFIREHDIPFESLNFEEIETMYLNSLEHSLKRESSGWKDTTALIVE